jgi:predicted transcriptional regulator
MHTSIVSTSVAQRGRTRRIARRSRSGLIASRLAQAYYVLSETSEGRYANAMGEETRTLQGESQIAVMQAVWRIGGGTVDDIRNAMPAELQSGYNTVQTILNRLAERGLLVRTPGQTARGPSGKIVYNAALSEGDYVAESIERSLAAASPEARRLAITQLIGRLEDDDRPRRKKKKRKRS